MWGEFDPHLLPLLPSNRGLLLLVWTANQPPGEAGHASALVAGGRGTRREHIRWRRLATAGGHDRRRRHVFARMHCPCLMQDMQGQLVCAVSLPSWCCSREAAGGTNTCSRRRRRKGGALWRRSVATRPIAAGRPGLPSTAATHETGHGSPGSPWEAFGEQGKPEELAGEPRRQLRRPVWQLHLVPSPPSGCARRHSRLLSLLPHTSHSFAIHPRTP